MSNIQEALIKRFSSHRVISWYDEKEELIEKYDALDIDFIEKIHVNNNEFKVKHIINK
jgi:hypothetical protein